MTTRESANPFPIDGPPNLDGFAMDEDDFNEAAKVFEMYGQYLRHKAHSAMLRKHGDIADATSIEARGQKIYDRLPDWARW